METQIDIETIVKELNLERSALLDHINYKSRIHINSDNLEEDDEGKIIKGLLSSAVGVGFTKNPNDEFIFKMDMSYVEKDINGIELSNLELEFIFPIVVKNKDIYEYIFNIFHDLLKSTEQEKPGIIEELADYLTSQKYPFVKEYMERIYSDSNHDIKLSDMIV